MRLINSRHNADCRRVDLCKHIKTKNHIKKPSGFNSGGFLKKCKNVLTTDRSVVII